MSAISYYSTKARAGARTERVRTDMVRSSAYILDPTLDRLKRQGSFTSDLGSRTSRPRARDHSLDITSRASRRSASIEISAPVRTNSVKLRVRDCSTDVGGIRSSLYSSSNGVGSRVSRAGPNYEDYSSSVGVGGRLSRSVTNNQDDDEHSAEYKNIMSKTDKYLTLSKYSKTDEKTAEINGMMEEERRSKAYSKIINQQSAGDQDQDAYRSTMSDMFSNTSGISAKTLNAISKDVLHKEDKGQKNYSWRKDMAGYEETLEKMSEHKRNVRDSTKATRDVTVSYKDTNSKIRSYDIDCRKNVDDEVRTVSQRPPVTSTPVTSQNKREERVNSYNTNVSSKVNVDSASPTPKGSWRKDIANYEDEYKNKLEARGTMNKINNKEQSNKVDSRTVISNQNNNTNTYSQSGSVTNSKQTTAVNKMVEKKVISDTKPQEREETHKYVPNSKTLDVKIELSGPVADNALKSQTETNNTKNISTSNTSVTSKKMCDENLNNKEYKPTTPNKHYGTQEEKTTTAHIENSKKTDEDKKVLKTMESKSLINKEPEKTKPKLEKPDAVQKVEPKTEETQNSTPKWKKPETAKKEEPIPVETQNTTSKWKKPDAVKKEEPKQEESPKSTPNWKKAGTVKKEDTKLVETPKPTPKWKKPEAAKKEEPKKEETPKLAETPKPTPKWKKPDTAKKEEQKLEETPKPTPKWKKPDTVKKEDPKQEETPKPAPKWKKPGTVKKEEIKSEEMPKPTPKWKKADTVKKEEPKPAETEKPVPKWKKPATEKKEEPKPAEPEKPVPKWKKPTTEKKEEPQSTKKPGTVKKEEQKQEETAEPAPKWKKPDTVKKEEPKPAVTEKPVPKWKKPTTEKKEEPKPAEPEKPAPKWKKPTTEKKEEPQSTKPEETISSLMKTNDSIKSSTETSNNVKTVENDTLHKTKEVSECDPKEDKANKVSVGAESHKVSSNESTSDTTSKTNEDSAKASDETKEEEPEEDTDGMKAMAKEQTSKFSSMEAEFEAGKSKLSGLRAKMKALRMKHKAAAEADAAAESARQG